MAVGAATPGIGPIDVNQLIGTADKSIVEPRNVAMLTDAFRQGVITADDIVNRLGELGKSKQKAEIMQAQEATSPEAQALRAQQVAAGTEQAELGELQAQKAQVLQQYPAVAYFEKFAPAAGIQVPMLPDGSPDYKQMEKIGAELALHQAQKSEAAQQLDNITTQESADGSVLFARTKQGEFVDPKSVSKLRAQATKTFSRQAPGTVQVSQTTTETVAPPMVEPRVTPSQPQIEVGPPQAGQPSGGGISLGAPKTTRPAVVDPVKRANDLAASQAMLGTIDNAKQLVNTPGIVGPLAGSAPVELGNRIAAAFGVREDEYENQRELEILISKKILEGAQIMKGNLSDKDVRFLKDSTPRLSDPPALWNRFLDTWKSLTEQNIAVLGSEGSGVLPESAALGQAAATATTPAPATAPVRVNSPAEAPPTAQFIQAPDGRVFKNPNYRPQ